jgi:hypothetical protein
MINGGAYAHPRLNFFAHRQKSQTHMKSVGPEIPNATAELMRQLSPKPELLL